MEMFYIILFIAAWFAFSIALGGKEAGAGKFVFGFLFTPVWMLFATTICGDSFFGMVVLFLVTVIGLNGMMLWKEKKDEEHRRINAEASLKVEALLKQYTPHLPKTEQVGVPLPISIDLVNKEVVDTVKKYKENTTANYGRYNAVSNELKTILACEGCRTENAKYIYLNENIDRIKSLKRECDAMFGDKSVLLNENSELMFELKLAFQYLQNSKKCVSSGADVRMFISSVQPQGLSIFRYETGPVTLFLGQHYFCLFSQVILVFDETGIFVNAIDPSAMRIKIRRQRAEVIIYNGEYRSDQCIAEDSKCILQGETRETWLHTCRDGSPDLRYRHNPLMSYRTDTYEYAVIKFMIAGKSVSVKTSSSAAADAFEAVVPMYIRKCNDKHDPIPQLMQLMKMIGDNEDECLQSIVESCIDKKDENNRFCKIVNL